MCFQRDFRFDDVSRIRRNDIFFHEGFIIIKVLKNKNDQLRKGDEVIFSEISGPACPFKLLKSCLTHFSIPLAPEISFLDPSLGGRTPLS